MVSGRIKRVLMVGAMLTLSVAGWAQGGPRNGMRGPGGAGMQQNLIASLPKQDLNGTEAAQLTYLREEEKLAHDVYLNLAAKWGARIFGNIAASEQRHYAALKVLLDRYEMADPAAGNAAGVFTDSRLQTVYNDLVAQGSVSLAAALRVGATIEDLDIHDLDLALAQTDNKDLQAIYQNIRNGSHNHLRVFIAQLKALGETYTARYISAAELDGILAGANAAGAGRGAGRNGMRGFGRGNGACPFGGVCPFSNTPGSGAGAQTGI